MRASSPRAAAWSLRSCGFCDELRQADEVVGGKGEGEGHARPIEPAEPGLAQAADGLQPAEDLLDPFTLSLAHRVARMAGGAAVDRGVTAGGRRLVGILRHVGGDAELAQLHDSTSTPSFWKLL